MGGREERNAGFRPRKGSTNGVANEYRVWIREEPIGVRDVLPRSREERQSGVLIGGIAHGYTAEGWKRVESGEAERRFDVSTCPADKDRQTPVFRARSCQLLLRRRPPWQQHLHYHLSHLQPFTYTHLQRRDASTPFFELHRCPLNIMLRLLPSVSMPPSRN